MKSYNLFDHIFQDCFTGTGAVANGAHKAKLKMWVYCIGPMPQQNETKRDDQDIGMWSYLWV